MTRVSGLLIGGEAHSEAELGVVFEQRVGPRGPAATRVRGIGRGRQIAAVNRRAARGVGDQQAIAKELRKELDVRSLAAARARTGELHEWFEQLHVLDLRMGQAAAVEFGDGQKELPVFALGLAKRSLRNHVDGFVFCLTLALGRANLDAQGATGAVFGRDLEGVSQILEFAPARLFGLERLRSVREQRGIVNLGADHRVRADEHALTALDAELLVPDGDFLSDVSLLPFGGAGGEGAVRREGADGQIIAATRDNFAEHIANELRSVRWHRRKDVKWSRYLIRDLHFRQMRQGLVDRVKIPFEDGFTAVAISLFNSLLDGRDRVGGRQDAANGEEAGLHDGVDAAAHAGLAGYGVGINDENTQMFLDDLLLEFPGQVIPHFGGSKRRIQQHARARNGPRQHVHVFDEREMVAADEIGSINQIGGANWQRAKPQMRDRHGARLLRVIDEVALRVIPSLLADNLDGVLVCADRTVGPEAVENRADGVRALGGKSGIVFEAGMRDVVVNANREMIARRGTIELVENGLGHGRRELLRRQPVTPANNTEVAPYFGKGSDNIEVERFANASRFLGAIQDDNG